MTLKISAQDQQIEPGAEFCADMHCHFPNFSIANMGNESFKMVGEPFAIDNTIGASMASTLLDKPAMNKRAYVLSFTETTVPKEGSSFGEWRVNRVVAFYFYDMSWYIANFEQTFA